MRNNLIYILLIFCCISIIYSCGLKNRANKKVIKNFDKREIDLIDSDSYDIAMRVNKINNYSDSILLRKKSSDINLLATDSLLIKKFSERLLRTVRDSMSLGVGIAAPQVGILKNIIWIQRFDKENYPFEVYINPAISNYSNVKQDCMEGCLSIPEIRGKTTNRSKKIIVDYLDLQNKIHRDTVEDFTAVIFQHEIDHLNGILFTDHLESER